jgi:polyhydroxybutyrate depolymerase
MQPRTGFMVALAFAFAFTAGLGGCTVPSSDANAPTATGGNDGSRGGSGGTSGGSGGTSGGSGGTSGGSNGSGGTGGTGGSYGSGGTTTSGGSTGSGGTGDGGSGGAGSGSGGTGGAATSAPDAAAPADASGGTPSAMPRPSAGCGKANPAVGKRMIMTGTNNQSYWVALPPGYDPKKPYPLGFAFHGFGLDDKTCHDGSECPGFRTEVGATAITVFPKSISDGWEFPVVYLSQNVKYVEDLIALMKNEYCVDEGKIFVSGVSSGGHFVHHLACQMGDRLWASIPVAAYLEPAARADCKGTPPQLHIRGITDSLAKGHDARDFQAMRNGCPTPPAGLAAMEMEVLSAFQMKTKPPKTRCLDYEGCSTSPLRYCVFSQVTYNGGTHGWPDDGGKLIADFLGKLK